MPEEVVPEALELDRENTTDDALNSSGKTEARIMPTCKIRERTDSYNEEESDSNSEDESPFSPESNEAAISRFEDSENLETTKLPILFQSMSVGSDTSADSSDSIVPGGRNFRAWNGSSSESSPHSSTSHSHSDSENESSEDEGRINYRGGIRKRLYELSLVHNANYEVTSKNNNNEEDESSSTRNIPVSSKNEESDVPASDDDSSDESTNEGEVEVITRGPTKSHSHSGKKPYNRHSPRYENTTEPLTPEDGSLCNRGHPFSFQYEDSDHASDDNSNDNCAKGEVEAEVLSWDSMQNHHDGTNIHMLEDTTETDVRSDSAIYLAPDCNVSECHTEEVMATLFSITSEEALDELYRECYTISKNSPTEEIPTLGAPLYGDNNSTYSPPEIIVQDFANQSPKNTSSWTIRQPMSSASSSNSCGIDDSPKSYVEFDPNTDESIAQYLQSSVINESGFNRDMPEVPCTANYEPQDESATQLLYPVILDHVGNQENVYTQPSDPVVSTQRNVNICQSDVFTGFNIQTGTQAQTISSQITGDSYPFVPTQLTQYQSNVQQQLPTRQLYIGTQPEGNSLSTSRGFVQINPTDKVQPKVTPVIQIGQIQTNNVINYNGSQTAPSQIPSTIREDAHLPTVVEIINKKSSYEKKDSRRIAPWSLSRLPSTAALDKLKQNVPEINAQAAMIALFEFNHDNYRERNEMGDTYLMSIVRNSNKLPSRLAHITPVLDKMIMIPESLTMTNKDGHDALYLAAINCPEYSYVTGVLAATIEKWCKSNDIWQRKYNRGDTLLHALAARGDSHADVLRELLAVQKASKRALFNLSAKNFDGKTPLHVAVKAHDSKRSVKVVTELMDRGADPVITDEETGNTPLHMAMSNRSCLGIVQVLLRKNGCNAVNMINKSGNTPLHLAADLLNYVDPRTQAGVCRQLIAFGGQTDIHNYQNKVPYACVIEERREMMAEIFCKRVVKN